MERNEESQFKVERQKGPKIIAEVKEMGFTHSSERQERRRVRLALPQARAELRAQCKKWEEQVCENLRGRGSRHPTSQAEGPGTHCS